MFQLTNLDKVYWPKSKTTKGALLEYYATMAPYILPYLKNRPLVMHRFPNGVTGESFYQKQAPDNLPNFVKTVRVAHEQKSLNYIVVQNVKTLLYVANLGSIELHPFSSRVNSLEKPDYMLLDLDPEGVPFSVVVDTALALRAILSKAKIPCFCKTSGKRGLHICVPLRAKYTYDQVKKFAYLIALMAHEELPKWTSLERSPKKRQKKVYIDTLQNERGQTMVCPYSVRAASSPTVSTPLTWKEVTDDLDPLEFTIDSIPKRLKQKGDLFKGILGKGIDLRKCLKV